MINVTINRQKIVPWSLFINQKTLTLQSAFLVASL